MQKVGAVRRAAELGERSRPESWGLAGGAWVGEAWWAGSLEGRARMAGKRAGPVVVGG